MKRLLSFLLLLSAVLFARADFATPDFAYPQTVVTDAEAVLRNSTKKSEGLTRLKAILEIVTARQMVAFSDSSYVMPALIERYAEAEPDRTVRGLMYLLESYSLSKLESWTSNGDVGMPLLPLPDDLTLWTSEQFAYRADQLLNTSIDLLRPAFKEPLKKFAEVITVPEGSEMFFTNIGDFVYCKAVDIAAAKDSKGKEMIAEAIANSTPGTLNWAYWMLDEGPTSERIFELYNQYPDSPGAGYLLWQAIKESDYPTHHLLSDEAEMRKVEQYRSMIKNYLSAHPGTYGCEQLENMLKRLAKPIVNVQFPNIVALGDSLEMVIEHGYAGRYGFVIYRDGMPWNYNRNDKTLRQIGRYEYTADPEVAYAIDTVRVAVKDAGNYLVKTFCDDSKLSNNYYSSRFTVTPWVPVVVNLKNEYAAIVANLSDGSPANGVAVKTSSTLGTTDADGFLAFVPKKGTDTSNLTLSKGGNSVVFSGNYEYDSYVPTYTWKSAEVFVDRPIYHPGDTVRWSAVLITKSYKDYSTKLMSSLKVEIKLKNASNQWLDTITGVTDDYGRIEGSFVLPTDCLQGMFNISVDSGKDHYGWGRFTVSDFKLPVFEIKDTDVARVGEDYAVSGNAMRFSGAPVPDAKVAVKVRTAPMLWRYDSPSRSFDFEGTTEADGSFRIIMPADTLGDGNYSCDITVTSVAADVADASIPFRSGKPYFVSGSVSGTYDVDSRKALSIVAYNSRLDRVSLDARWQLCADSTAVAAGDCRIDSIGTVFDWTAVSAGTYTLKVMPVDTTMFTAFDAGQLTLYSSERNDIPEGFALLCPRTTFKNVEGATIDVKVGTASAGTYYVVAFDAAGKPFVKLHKLDKGFSNITLPLTAEEHQSFAISTIAGGKLFTQSIEVYRKKPSTALTLKGESWRDNITPGAREHWRLRLTDAAGNGMAGTMVATLYNRALDSFGRSDWPDNFNSFLAAPTPNYRYNVQFPSMGHGLVSSKINIDIKDMVISDPVFNYIGEAGTFNFLGAKRFRGRDEIYAVAYGTARVTDMSMVSKKMAAPMIAENSAVMADAAETEEAVVEEDAGATTGAVTDETADFQYRVAEVLQAFWMPSVTLNADGEATLDFYVPDAVGAWTFRASAWTEDCRGASMLATLVSSKPVMVQPSLPRFMRRGDRAHVLATVMNRTDSAQVVTTVIEIFDPVSGDVLATTNHTDTISANSQAIVGADLDAPATATAIGYRVRSSAGGFTDGEQDLIPVVEASTIAIDSEVFYLSGDETEFTATIPADSNGDGVVALQYCNNPVWDVVKTLPGLYEHTPHTSLAAASSAFAAYTARGLYDSYPEIRRALDIWQADSTALRSKLYDNEDIKLALLARTPFVGSANAQTEQMERLALTFDKKIIDRTASTAVKTLAKLQNSDGGFGWSNWSRESSAWCTRSVLLSLGRLNAMGYMPADATLGRVVRSALNYIDAKVAKDDYTYAYIYSMFPGQKPSTLAGEQALDEVSQQLVKKWKKLPTDDKVRGALILNATGNKAVAREIIGSVTQFAVKNPKAGVSFPSVTSVDSYARILEAYAKIDPASPLIDGMRQWLVLKTQSTFNLGTFNPTSLVSAILSTGARWTAERTSTAAVTVDGRPLAVSDVEAATGTFSVRLDPSSSARAVTFTRPGATSMPAYGSVMTVATRPLDKIEAAGSKQLSITKRFYVQRGGQWVETDTFALGERVRVTLMLRADELIQYVTIRDDRPAGFEPVDQMPGWVYDGTLGAYRENTDMATNLYVSNLPKGVYYLTYEMTAAYTGRFVSGTAMAQSQYAPELTARSGAAYITIR